MIKELGKLFILPVWLLNSVHIEERTDLKVSGSKSGGTLENCLHFASTMKPTHRFIDRG